MKFTRLSQGLFITAILLLTMILAKAIFIPLAFAVLISFLLYPICKKIETKLSRVVAVSLVFLSSIIILTVLVLSIVKVLQIIMMDLRNLEIVYSSFKEKTISGIASFMGLTTKFINSTIKENIGVLIEGPVSFLGLQIMKSTNILFSVMITRIFAFLMLMYRTVFNNFILSLVAKNNRKEIKVVGEQINLNPFISILALLTEGVVWGIPGFVLALLYMAITKIVLEHFAETASLATLFCSAIYNNPEMFKKKFDKPKFSLVNLLKKKKGH